MAKFIFTIVFGIGWVIAIFIAINDFRILLRGKIEEDTNMTGEPIEHLTGLNNRPGFIRLVAALRLIFAIVWITAIAVLAIRNWWS